MLLIQTFFAGLGDPEEITLKDQQLIARNAKKEFDAQKKKEAEQERTENSGQTLAHSRYSELNPTQR